MPPDGNYTPKNNPLTLSVDWELYADALENSDLTDDEKREFIETLWGIIVAFVDLGFGIHPLQQALEEGSVEDEQITAHCGTGMVLLEHTEQD